jgi:hypothetical protein
MPVVLAGMWYRHRYESALISSSICNSVVTWLYILTFVSNIPSVQRWKKNLNVKNIQMIETIKQ